MVREGKEKQEDEERDQQLWILTTSCMANMRVCPSFRERDTKIETALSGRKVWGKVIALGERVSSYYNSIGTVEMLIFVSRMSRTSYL